MAMSRYAAKPANGYSRQDASDAVTAAEFASMRERQNNFSNDLHTLNDNITTIRAEFSGQFVKLEATLGALATKIADGSKTPWGVLLTGLSFLLAFSGTVGWLAYAPIRESLLDNRSAINVTQAAITLLSERSSDKFVAKDTLSMVMAAKDKQDATELKFVVDRMDRLTDAFREMRASMVPRQEHDRQWAAQAAQDADLRRGIDETKLTVSNIYNPKDAFNRMERKLEEDEALILQLLRAKPGP